MKFTGIAKFLVGWKPQDDERLLEMWAQGTRRSEIASALNRSEPAIDQRVKFLRAKGRHAPTRVPGIPNRTERVLEIITGLATRGEGWPGARVVAADLGLSKGPINRAIKDLVDSGTIKITGYTLAKAPVFEIVALGISTAMPEAKVKPEPVRKAKPEPVPVKTMNRPMFLHRQTTIAPATLSEMDRAVQALRQRGLVVYAERVNESKITTTGKYVINNVVVEASEVLSRAAPLLARSA